MAQATPDAAPVPTDESLPAYIIYTSGSTGRPKGVAVPRRALANFIQSMRQAPGIAAGDRLLSVTTVAFDIAGLELYLPLVAGACVYVAGTDVVVDGARLLQLMQDWRATLMQATPATWKLLVAAGWHGRSDLKALCGGEALPQELAAQLLERAGSVWNMYGPTETTIWSTLHQVRPADDSPVPIGVPIDQTGIYILDPHRQLVPWGMPGEIWIGGLGVASSYFGRPELTAERFVEDPFLPAGHAGQGRMYRTGDAGRLRSDGLLEHLGRLDGQIKLRGFRIEPGEIEQVLKEHPGVRDALVLALDVGHDDRRLVAYYVPMQPGVRDAARTGELLELARRRLPAYMVPTTLVALPAFPMTPNNKIDRSALPAPTMDLPAADAAYLPPRDEVEAALAGHWCELLGLSRVGIRENFFLLGGHSLLALRLFAQVERRFGAKLPLAILFERPTIEFLAEAIRARTTPQEKEPSDSALQETARQEASMTREFIVPIQRSGRRPPLFCVHGAGGNVLNLWPLSRHLQPDQPFYGIQARGVDGLARPMGNIRKMAAAYLQEVRQVQATGPYYLSGYCAGGWVALEMARQLHGAGEQVALLTLLDCYHPRLQPEVAPLRGLLRGIRREGLWFLVHGTPARVWRYLSSAVTRVQVRAYRTVRRAVPQRLRNFWLTRAMLNAAASYRPRPYAGRTLLIRANDITPHLRDVGPRMGWDGLLTGQVEVIDTPGDHHALAEEPYVGYLAARMRAVIDHVLRSGPAPDHGPNGGA